MKISFPTTIDGWIKLGKLIFGKSQNLGDEPPISESDADVKIIGTLAVSAEKKLAEADKLHRDAETLNEQGDKDLALMEDEIRRVGRVLTGRNKYNPKATGNWGFEIDESADPVPGTDVPPPAE